MYVRDTPDFITKIEDLRQAGHNFLPGGNGRDLTIHEHPLALRIGSGSPVTDTRTTEVHYNLPITIGTSQTSTEQNRWNRYGDQSGSLFSQSFHRKTRRKTSQTYGRKTEYHTNFLQKVHTLQWRHNGRDCASNHKPHDCLLYRLFRYRSKKKITALHHWPLHVKFTGDRWIPCTKGQ